eukprot:2541812-Prymnesium_polylepis.1
MCESARRIATASSQHTRQLLKPFETQRLISRLATRRITLCISHLATPSAHMARTRAAPWQARDLRGAPARVAAPSSAPRSPPTSRASRKSPSTALGA